MVPRSCSEKIEEFVAELIVSNESTSMWAAIAATVTKFPNSPALDAAFAFTSVASALERPFFSFTDNDKKRAAEMYRAMALFVADIYAVEKLYGPSPTCAQISDFWAKTGETLFTSAFLSAGQ